MRSDQNALFAVRQGNALINLVGHYATGHAGELPDDALGERRAQLRGGPRPRRVSAAVEPVTEALVGVEPAAAKYTDPSAKLANAFLLVKLAVSQQGCRKHWARMALPHLPGLYSLASCRIRSSCDKDHFPVSPCCVPLWQSARFRRGSVDLGRCRDSCRRRPSVSGGAARKL